MSDETGETLADRLKVFREHTCCYPAEEIDALLADVRAEAIAPYAELSAELEVTKAMLAHERERVSRLAPAVTNLHAVVEAILDDRNFLAQRIGDLAAAWGCDSRGRLSPRGQNLLNATVDHPRRPANRSQT